MMESGPAMSGNDHGNRGIYALLSRRYVPQGMNQNKHEGADLGLSRRRIIALAVVAVLLIAYAVAGFIAVPHYGRQAAVDFVRTHYGRTLTIGDMRFNP